MAAAANDLGLADAVMKGRDAYQKFLVASLVCAVMAAAGWVTMEPLAPAAIGIRQLFEPSRPKLTPFGAVPEFLRGSELPRVLGRAVPPPVS